MMCLHVSVSSMNLFAISNEQAELRLFIQLFVLCYSAIDNLDVLIGLDCGTMYFNATELTHYATRSSSGQDLNLQLSRSQLVEKYT